MKYEPDSDGYFAGQSGYGYVSIDRFVECVRDYKEIKLSRADVRKKLACLEDTTMSTAILEAGRISLDEKRGVLIQELLDRLE